MLLSLMCTCHTCDFQNRIKAHTVNLHGEAFLTSDAPTEDARNLDYIKLGKEEMDNEDDFEEETGLGYPGAGVGVHKVVHDRA